MISTMKKLVILFVFASSLCYSQKKEAPFTKPKLVVGIVVDQMRYDYITRFWDHYDEGGFKRLVGEGFNCKNNHFNYVPTYTGPGHTSVYTGTTPSTHGVIANHWYDKEIGVMVYCASDDRYETVGSESGAGKMSPHRMKTTTLGDQNRLATQFRGKSIGIAVKDRGAILPAGHSANAAYWFEGKKDGKWISSSYYMDTLPEWVKSFNASKTVNKYLKTWDTYKSIASYTESGPDENDFEGTFRGEEKAVFPHRLKKLSKENGNYDILKATPYGNSLTTDFAIAAIEGEHLGKDDITDVLAISYSSTDYVGHQFGVNSKEIQDTYIRLDKDLERLLEHLDMQVGSGEYTLFLTADHAAVHVPSFLRSVKIPAGYLDSDAAKKAAAEFMQGTFGRTDLIANASNNQLFLNHGAIRELADFDHGDVVEAMAAWLITQPQIDKVFTAEQLHKEAYNDGIALLLKNGFNQRRSGDIIIVPDPATISYPKTGSTHGSGMNYDTHVPLIFFGKGINKGSTVKKTRIIDAAPTISVLLGNAFPNGATGTVLHEVID